MTKHSIIKRLYDIAELYHKKIEIKIPFYVTEDDLNATLAWLTMHVKYNIFDLEATRRENEYLKRIIEDLVKRAG